MRVCVILYSQLPVKLCSTGVSRHTLSQRGVFRKCEEFRETPFLLWGYLVKYLIEKTAQLSSGQD